MNVNEKIARLIAERGWNQEQFATRARLNRNTVRQLLTNPRRRLHNQTIRQCADALGIPVHALTAWPLDQLLAHARGEASASESQLLALATQPELHAWRDEHPTRAAALSPAEVDELLSLQGTGGPLTAAGVEHFVTLLERKRELKARLDAIAGTEYLPLLEQLIGLLYEKIQPYR